MNTLKFDSSKEIEDAIRGGLNQPFWIILSRIIKENIEFLTNQIAEDDDLTEQQRNDLRRWRKLNKELLNLPEAILADAEHGKDEPLSMDPYARVYSDLVQRPNLTDDT